jgi:hypothetical protein
VEFRRLCGTIMTASLNLPSGAITTFKLVNALI